MAGFLDRLIADRRQGESGYLDLMLEPAGLARRAGPLPAEWPSESGSRAHEILRQLLGSGVAGVHADMASRLPGPSTPGGAGCAGGCASAASHSCSGCAAARRRTAREVESSPAPSARPGPTMNEATPIPSPPRLVDVAAVPAPPARAGSQPGGAPPTSSDQAGYIDEVFEAPFATTAARRAARDSQLPGQVNGPADAFRHIVWSAELARRYGAATARRLTAAHEMHGQASEDWTPEAEAMDRANNEVGLNIGQQAESYDDVLALAQAVMKASSPNGDGTLQQGVDSSHPAARWLSEAAWANNPEDPAHRPHRRLTVQETNWYSNPAVGAELKFPSTWSHRSRYRFGGPEFKGTGSQAEAWLGMLWHILPWIAHEIGSGLAIRPGAPIGRGPRPNPAASERP